MTTNGFLLSSEKYIKLHEMHVYHFQVTMDGVEETHDIQRKDINGNGTFYQIFNNLKDICKIKFSDHIQSNIMIRINFTRPMYERIDEILNFYGKNFACYNNVSFLFRTAGDYGGESVNSIRDVLLSEKELTEIYKKVYMSKYCFNVSTQIRMLRDASCYASRKNSYVIGADLTVYKCTVHFEESKIGVIGNNGTWEVNEDKNALWYVIGMITALEKCTNCKEIFSCLSTKCPYSTLYSKGWKEEKRCPHLMSDSMKMWITKCNEKMLRKDGQNEL